MIVPVQYNPQDYGTDFKNIIQDPYTVCMFAENLECLIHSIEGKVVKPGGGTACVRGEPNASPIPTGFREGGFTSLQQKVNFKDDNFIVMDLINHCFEGLRTKIRANRNTFRKVVYSADADGRWSCGIFTVGDEVLDYITKKIEELNNDKEFLDWFVQTSDIRKMDNFDSFFSRAP